MKVTFLKDHNNWKQGDSDDLQEGLANYLSNMGVVSIAGKKTVEKTTEKVEEKTVEVEKEEEPIADTEKVEIPEATTEKVETITTPTKKKK